MYVEEEPEWNYRVSETSAILSSDPLGEAAEATAKGTENGKYANNLFFRKLNSYMNGQVWYFVA